MKRARRLSTLLVVVGVAVIVYGTVTVLWRDPVTDVYTRWRQSHLAAALQRTFDEYRAAGARPSVAGAVAGMRRVDVAQERKAVAAAARHLRADLELGEPLGRIKAPKLDLDAVFVHGTRWGPDLSKGPGHYEGTSLPGLDETTAIAGHRTTFGAPFRHIDDLERGDEIVLELRHGTFRYRVFAHEVVANDDWSIIRKRGFDTLVLSACHPLYSASKRWIVYARLVSVEPVGGRDYALPGERGPAAAA